MSDGTDSGITTDRNVARGAKPSIGKGHDLERVTASEIVIGNKILVPSSRHPQAITDVLTVNNEAGQTVRLMGDDFEWVVRRDHEVQREVVQEAEGD